MTFRISVALLSLLSLLSTAHAQISADEEAHLRFEAGHAAFASGRYEEALNDFQGAYELSHRWQLLYNIGQAYDRLGMGEDTVAAFTQFLAEAPADEPTRADAERRIAAIRQEQARARPEPAPTPAPPPPRRGDDPAPWIVAAIGGAVLVAGAIVLALGVADQASVEGATAPMHWSDVSAAYDRAPILQGVGIAALVVGAVGVSAGLVWGSSQRPASGDASTRLRVMPGGLVLEGAF